MDSAEDEEADGGEGGEGQGEVLEGLLGDATKGVDAQECAEEDDGNEGKIDEESVWHDEAEVGLEGNLDPVEDEIVPGGGAHEENLVELHSEEEDDGNGTGGVGDHGGESGEEAEGPGEPPAMRDVVGGEVAELAEELKEEEDDDDGGDETVDLSGVNDAEGEEADDDSDKGGGRETKDGLPVGVRAEVDDGEEVGDYKEGEDNAEGGAAGEDGCEEHDGEDSEAGYAGLGEADEKGAEAGDDPVEDGEIGNGAASLRSLWS